jgi:hypothetical protein
MPNKKARRGPEALLSPRDFLGPEFFSELEREHRHPRFGTLRDLAAGAGLWVKYDPQLWETAREWWPVRLLRELAADGKAETYKRVLFQFLIELQAMPPEGVMKPFKWTRGRPRATRAIFDRWCSMGRPALTTRMADRLAKEFYPDEFKRAAGKPKKLRDRVRATIRRHDSAATKSA